MKNQKWFLKNLIRRRKEIIAKENVIEQGAGGNSGERKGEERRVRVKKKVSEFIIELNS